ncbi:hypothetical protein [Sporosarcina sp. G11-34]|uniref:hypothetical protein n=1 Tax=Sporosarcina sp. G11-34 TaxID=2849605 RepID=UPI0022A94E13|nr:hypothetical protein [Sporosarcina sp. G11-34]MCZ2260717.1 hypothetical protein [Sporosarcina sp. G11-34]
MKSKFVLRSDMKWLNEHNFLDPSIARRDPSNNTAKASITRREPSNNIAKSNIDAEIRA